MQMEALTEQCIISGLPFRQPSRTLYTKIYMMGISDKGINLLQKSSNVIDNISNREEFYDTENRELIALNWWVKKVESSNQVKLKKIINWDSESINCQSTKGAIANIAELKDLELKTMCEFVVERQILNFEQNFIVHIDRVTYPDGDPYCVCSFRRIENIPSDMYAQLVLDCISPVRSKICEYLYRYERKTYETLEHNNCVEDIYEMSVLQSQWDQVQLHKSLDQIIARVEGRGFIGPDPWEGLE